VLKKAQDLDDTEHKMLPFIERFKSIRQAVEEVRPDLVEALTRWDFSPTANLVVGSHQPQAVASRGRHND